ncbi:CobW family GTP-binding protein [Streptomyces sp. NPDC086010]|uniref:CobW family GTP-binding protein n=1 Tax=Streptomyces sp. NPDC086010 TaxID=3365745 RepID=UPI0037D16488
MTPPHTSQIPVLVLAGFLGSGKTTLLNHLLRNRSGNRIGVIVNDFGSIEIDAMTVAGQVGSTVSLGNGCLCCAVDASELDTYLETLTRPSARLDVIVIEASGLAEPQELVRMLLASDNPHIRYGGLVEVVDAAEFRATRERHPEIDRHLAVADLIVLNKTDRVTEADLSDVRGAVGEAGGTAAVISAAYGRIDPELLFDPALAPDEDDLARQLSFEDLLPGTDRTHEAHLHAAYESVSFSTDMPLSPRRFMEFLDSRPAGLYRIKGFADFGAGDRDNRYALHAVGRFLRFVPQAWARQEPRRTQLVLIGAGIDAEALRKQLEECREEQRSIPDGRGRDIPDGHGWNDGTTTREQPDAEAGADGAWQGIGTTGRRQSAETDADELERSMWGVLRYVRQPDDGAR